MKHGRFVFGVLTLALVAGACSDPTNPRYPNTGNEENPPMEGSAARLPTQPISPIALGGLS